MIKPNSKIIYKQLPEDDPTNRKPDISLAKELLNWKPTVNVEQGFLRTIMYFSEQKLTK